MRSKYSLAEAGRLLGISGNAVRLRTKKSPDLYPIERDNSGKIWVWLDPQELPPVGVQVVGPVVQQLDPLGVQAVTRIAVLETALAESERARADLAEDRDRWRSMAETLAARPRRRWWPFG